MVRRVCGRLLERAETLTDAVLKSLTSADTNLEAAERATDAARQGLEEAKARIVRNGFAGVAANLSRVGDDLDTMQGLTAGIRSEVQGATGQARAVTDRSTPEEVIGHLTPVAKACDEATADINRLLRATGAAKQHINAALSGGSPGQLLAKVDRVSTFQKGAYKDIAAAKPAAEAALERARQAGE